jgi:HAMP domain-containing protein
MAPIATDGAGRLTWRLLLTVGAVVAVVLMMALVGLSAAAERTATATSARALERTTRLLAVLLDEREAGMARAAQVFAQNPIFRSIVLSGRTQDVLDQSIEAAQRTGASWVQVTDSMGMRLAKSDEPAAPASMLAGSALIAGALHGDVTGGMGTSGDTTLFQAVAVPIVGATMIAGTLMATLAIDSLLAAEVRETTASEVAFFVLDSAGNAHVVASSFGRDASLATALSGAPGRRVVSGDTDAVPIVLTLGAREFVGRAAPLRSAGGAVLGGMVALRSREAERAPFAGLRGAILTAGIVGLALAFLLAWVTARSLARPILALTQATRRVAQGDYDVHVEVQSRDEIGTLAESIRAMITDLREKASLVAVLQGTGAEQGGGLRPHMSGDFTAMVAPSDVTEIETGAVVGGRYEIREALGAGGAGVVFAAFDRELGEVVALKTLHADTVTDEPAALERLKSEVRLARRLAHRNIVRTYDLGLSAGRYWITMELVSGTSLRTLLDREHALPLAASLAIGKQLFRALEVAHESGILHRDIKPQNLMVQPDGTLKVMDFGIARAIIRSSGLTQAGLVLGTPEYMSPEQLLGEEIDARSDLFSAGVVLYECVTGRRPIEADSPAVLIARMLHDAMPSAASVAPSVPPALSALLDRLLAKSTDLRPASGGEVSAALQALDASRAGRAAEDARRGS